MRLQNDSYVGSLSYWHAIQTFGAEATNAILEEPAWREKYPKMVDGIGSNDLRTKNVTLLPKEVLVAIASLEDCLYDFHADPDGIHLYCSFRGQPLALPFDAKDAIRLTRQEALAEYGVSCIFRAADLGVGRKGEQEKGRHPARRRDQVGSKRATCCIGRHQHSISPNHKV